MLHDINARKVFADDYVRSLGTVPSGRSSLRVNAGRRLVELGARLAGEPFPRDHERPARLASSSGQ